MISNILLSWNRVASDKQVKKQLLLTKEEHSGILGMLREFKTCYIPADKHLIYEGYLWILLLKII